MRPAQKELLPLEFRTGLFAETWRRILAEQRRRASLHSEPNGSAGVTASHQAGAAPAFVAATHARSAAMEPTR